MTAGEGRSGEVLDTIMGDAALGVREKQLRIAQALHAMGGEGIELALSTVHKADDEALAAMTANFLAQVPGYNTEKDRLIANLIAERPARLSAAANLIQDAKDATARALLAHLLQQARPETELSAAFELALHFPDLVRPHHQALKACNIYEQVLPGAPDDWVETLLAHYHQDADDYWLFALGQIRTDSARAALIELSKRQDAQQREYSYALLEAGGIFPDSRLSSIYHDCYRGYMVEAGLAPHAMGGRVEHPVPQCPFTSITAELVLALESRQLSMHLASPHMPRFFWYEGTHPPGSVYMEYTDQGVNCLMANPAAAHSHELFPQPRAMHLVPRNRGRGRGGCADPGFAQHQVGGFPYLLYPERFPRCPRCNQGMKFMASIDSGITPVGMIAVKGTLYCYWCDECSVACTVAQTL